MEASKNIDAQIRGLNDWRGPRMTQLRGLIHSAVPGVEETFKWMGTACFEKGGILTTLEPYKGWIKMTFLHGAALPDPKKVFNSELAGNARRAIKLEEKDKLNAAAFKGLIKAAAAYYVDKAKAGKMAPKPKAKPAAAKGAKRSK